jgi:hypothetical protein
VSSPGIIKLIERILDDPRAYSHLLTLLTRHADEATDWGLLSSEVVPIINRGFERHGFDKERIEIFTTIVQEHAGDTVLSVTDRVQLAAVILGDILKYNNRLFAGGDLPVRDLRSLATSGRPRSVGDYDVFVTDTLDYHFWRNLSIGLSRGSLRRNLRAFAANNHLMMKALEDPTVFIQGMITRLDGFGLPSKREITIGLENLSEWTSKVDDVSIFLRIPELRWKTKAGRDLVLLENVHFRASFDSKVYIDPNRIASRRILEQQMSLFFSDRITDNVVPLLRRLKKLEASGEVNLFDQGEIIDQFIPAIFQHFVHMPKDLRVSARTHERYAEYMRGASDEALEAMIPDDLRGTPLSEMFRKALRDHLDDHFSNGRYLTQASDMRYFDF